MSEYSKLLEFLEIEIGEDEFERNLKYCYMSDRYKYVTKELFIKSRSINEMAIEMGVTRGTMLDIKNKVRKMLKREENIAVLNGKRENEPIDCKASILLLFPRDTPLNRRLVNALFRSQIMTVQDLLDVLKGNKEIKEGLNQDFSSIGKCKGIGVDSINHIVKTLISAELLRKEEIATIKINNNDVIC